jgi:hypothetical protein
MTCVTPDQMLVQMDAARERASRLPAWLTRSKPSKLDVCPTCGGPTEHICSWVCVDLCRRCSYGEQVDGAS